MSDDSDYDIQVIKTPKDQELSFQLFLEEINVFVSEITEEELRSLHALTRSELEERGLTP
jgi:hypothetical protein